MVAATMNLKSVVFVPMAAEAAEGVGVADIAGSTCRGHLFLHNEC